MATYVVGDLQGCHRTLRALLAALRFDAAQDKLWFTGDLVNRGPDSLGCLRLVHALGDAAVSVLGNHDLHLLAVAHGVRARGALDTLQNTLDAPDSDVLLEWLRQRPLIHAEGKATMIHAAIPPEWDVITATAAAREVESELHGSAFENLLRNMYGDTPSRWAAATNATQRHRYTINALTRARCFDASGKMDLKFKGTPESIPPGLRPWYETLHPTWHGSMVLAGHWSAAGLRQGHGFVTLDSGCVWGGSLSAYCLESGETTAVPCAPGDQASTRE
ncbi:MAG: symmetrical bis(5'-nucleosyl)-tetraphosphatase [Betaproteobacteria bacterium]|nr:symmetrical bis(5'-nucleosyl)-tetraphosphatase [Betaproteobacteria bacterium]